MAFFVAFANAMYSASAKDVATVDCFFDNQVTVLLAILKINSSTEWQSSGS